MRARDLTHEIEYVLPTATIAASGTQSSGVDLGGHTLVGLFIPSTFDGTTITVQVFPTSAFATSHTAQAASTGGASTALTLTVAAGQYAPIENLAITAGWQYIKLTAGSTQTTTDTVITLAVRPV